MVKFLLNVPRCPHEKHVLGGKPPRFWGVASARGLEEDLSVLSVVDGLELGSTHMHNPFICLIHPSIHRSIHLSIYLYLLSMSFYVYIYISRLYVYCTLVYQ